MTISQLVKPLRSLVRRVLDSLDRSYVLAHIKRVKGPLPDPKRKNFCSVITLVRDGEENIREFIAHYSKLGIEHIYIIDNQSRDKTAAIAQEYPQVTLFTTNLRFSQYEARLRRYFLQHFFKESWVFFVDIDEHFEYPYQSQIPLATFLDYLQLHNYNAVTACMLDMYHRGSHDKAPHTGFSDFYPLVNIKTIDKDAYPQSWLTRNNLVPEGITIFKNGIRKKALKSSHEFLLVKHPLMFIDSTIEPFSHPHYCAQARIADVAGVLLHYKFTAGFLQRAKLIVKDPLSYPTWVEEHKAYIDFFESNDSWSDSKDDYVYKNVEDLHELGLISISQDYIDFVQKNSRKD